MIDLVLPDNPFYSFFLPFITIVVLVFGILTKLKMFETKMSMFIAIMISLIVFGGGHYPTIMKVFSGGGIIFILLFLVMFFIWIAFTGKKKKEEFLRQGE